MKRSTDRLLALAMLVVGFACFAKLYLVLGGKPPAATSAGIFGAAGMLSILAGLSFLAGLLPGAPRHEPSAPLFGRDAATVPAGRPRLRRIALAVPLIALVVILADQFGRWRETGGDAAAPAREVAVAPAEPGTEPASAPVAPAPTAGPSEPAAAPPQPAARAQPATTPAWQTALAPATPPQTLAPPRPPPPAQPTAPEGHRDAVVWLAVSADGHQIMSASTDRMIKLWDIDGKRLIRDLGVHKDMARSALFMPDGRNALTAGDDGEIVLRQLSDGTVLHVFSSGANGGVRQLKISPDGKLAVSGHDTGSVVIWDLLKGTVLHVLPGHDWSVSSVAISPDGTRALTGSIDGELKLWDMLAGKQLRSWHGHERGAYGALFLADGHHAVTGSGDYTIKLWDLDTFKEVRRFDGHSGTVYALALSADGKRLGSASLDGTARIWNMDTGAEIAEFDPGTGPIYSVAFAADGTLLTGGLDGTIRNWPAAGGEGTVLFAGAPE
ncbi:MAG: WD40 repeat domain-containing protein [Mesorhizobium sp.]|nr:MAG: WD40 repeat domain-containing protein [Mesorhizobium sp.]